MVELPIPVLIIDKETLPSLCYAPDSSSSCGVCTVPAERMISLVAFTTYNRDCIENWTPVAKKFDVAFSRIILVA